MDPYLVLCNAPTGKKDDVEVEVWAENPFAAIREARARTGFTRLSATSLAPSTGACRLG